MVFLFLGWGLLGYASSSSPFGVLLKALKASERMFSIFRMRLMMFPVDLAMTVIGLRFTMQN